MASYTVQTADGPKRRTIYGKKDENREDVAAKLTKAMADRDGGITYDAGKLTVEDHLLGWLSDSVRGTVRQRTFERYESIVRVHLIPAIGRIKLKTLTLTIQVGPVPLGFDCSPH
jgi:integrase